MSLRMISEIVQHVQPHIAEKPQSRLFRGFQVLSHVTLRTKIIEWFSIADQLPRFVGTCVSRSSIQQGKYPGQINAVR